MKFLFDFRDAIAKQRHLTRRNMLHNPFCPNGTPDRIPRGLEGFGGAKKSPPKRLGLAFNSQAPSSHSSPPVSDFSFPCSNSAKKVAVVRNKRSLTPQKNNLKLLAEISIHLFEQNFLEFFVMFAFWTKE